jgi:hypothetical protein
MKASRVADLIARYSVPDIGGDLERLAAATRTARGYLMATDDSQPVDDDTLRADIEEIESYFAAREESEPAEEKFIIVVGNIADGFNFVGPFDCFEDADEHAQNFKEITWIATLHNAKESSL